MRKYRVVYSATEHSTATLITYIAADNLEFRDGQLIFRNDQGYVVSAFQTWVRIDRVFD